MGYTSTVEMGTPDFSGLTRAPWEKRAGALPCRFAINNPPATKSRRILLHAARPIEPSVRRASKP